MMFFAGMDPHTDYPGDVMTRAVDLMRVVSVWAEASGQSHTQQCNLQEEDLDTVAMVAIVAWQLLEEWRAHNLHRCACDKEAPLCTGFGGTDKNLLKL